MVGKTVKCDIGLISFFYPDYIPVTEVSFLNMEDKVIYVGKWKAGLVEKLRANTKEFINTVGKPEVDFSNRTTLIEFVYAKWKREVPKKLRDLISELSDDEFIYSCKCLWVSGKWPYSVDENEMTVYNLFLSMNDSVQENLRVLIALLDKYPTPVIASSFVTFLSRVMDLDAQEVNPRYKQVLKQFYQRSANKIKPAVRRYSLMGDVRQEVALVDLILQVR